MVFGWFYRSMIERVQQLNDNFAAESSIKAGARFKGKGARVKKVTRVKGQGEEGNDIHPNPHEAFLWIT
jgi:hypothetical protein